MDSINNSQTYVEELKISLERERKATDFLMKENEDLKKQHIELSENEEVSLKNQNEIIATIKELSKNEKVDIQELAEDIEVLKLEQNTSFNSIKDLINKDVTNAEKNRKLIAEQANQERKKIYDKFNEKKIELEENIDSLEKNYSAFTEHKASFMFLLGLFIGGAADFILVNFFLK